jgi:hypothetical protein
VLIHLDGKAQKKRHRNCPGCPILGHTIRINPLGLAIFHSPAGINETSGGITDKQHTMILPIIFIH